MPSVSRSGGGRSASSSMRGRVVLEPGEPAGRVEPDAAQEPELADRGARRTARAGRRPRRTSSTARLRGVEPLGHEHDRRRRSRGRRPPTPPSARPRSATATARIGAYHSLPLVGAGRRSRRAPMPARRTSLPAGAVVPSTNRWRASRSWGATRSSTSRSTPGRHVAVNDGSARRARTSSTRRRGSTASSTTVNAEAQDPADASRTATGTGGRARTPGRAARSAGRGTRAARGARSSPTDAWSAATCDSSATLDPVAEAALHAVEQHPHVPGADRRDGQPDDRDPHLGAARRR